MKYNFEISHSRKNMEAAKWDEMDKNVGND